MSKNSSKLAFTQWCYIKRKKFEHYGDDNEINQFGLISKECENLINQFACDHINGIKWVIPAAYN